MPPPRGGALLANLGDNYALSNSSNTSENLSAEEQAKAELDANILAGGGLGLDPENDPIVATTDWGLDIKYHADWGSFGTLSSGALSGYVYFTMGSYSSTAVNWVIIGVARNIVDEKVYYDGTHNMTSKKYSSYSIANYISEITANANYYKNNLYETSTDAGAAITNTGSKGLVYDFARVLFANAVANSEIPSDCVLCISEKILCKSVFNPRTATYLNRYSGSTLQSTMSSLYSSGLGLTATQKSYIQPQTLSTIDYYTSRCATTNQYFFPLAAAGTTTEFQDRGNETYVIGNYLATSSLKIACNLGTTQADSWWLRTGNPKSNYSKYIYEVQDGGSAIRNSATYSDSKGVRPAFVLKL